MLDYIFCDLDGPILDGKWRHYNCYKDIISMFGGTAVSLQQYWDMKRNRLPRTELLDKSVFTGSYTDYFNEWMLRIEQKKYLQYDLIKPMVKETLNKWRDYTENIWLVTQRQNIDNLQWQLSQFEIVDCFNKVITCPPLEQGAKYRILKDVKFDNAIFIGDTEEDMNAARFLNIRSIAITTGVRCKRFLSADFYAEEIKDIAPICFN